LLEGYGAKTLAAREEERRRIARELHDGPLQSVVLLWRRLDAIDLADPQLRDALAKASASAEVVAAELRRFSRDLRPSVLDDLGLSAALKAEVAAFESRTGIRGRYSLRGSTDGLDVHEQLAFFRVCQEALHNVERHARASTAAVRLSVSATRAELVVEDDGLGMTVAAEPAELVRPGKLGVVGMQERARLIGGTCTVRGGRKGTIVRLTVPRVASN
jgi:two-component system NarL family sensor kinase